MWSDWEVSNLEEIYWATKAANIAIPLFEQSETYKHVKHRVLDHAHLSDDIFRSYPWIPPDTEDWSILVRFQEHPRRLWRPSTFISNPADVSRFDLPKRFVTIQPSTGLHHHQPDRDLDSDEWDAILSRLNKKRLTGVVVNGPDNPPAPRHHRLIDLTGKTSTAESLSILLHGKGYWGVASWLAVIAPQVFLPDELWIKGTLGWYRQHRYVYLAPHTYFPTVFKHLKSKHPWLNLTTVMRTLRMTKTRIWNNELVVPGSVVEANDRQADELVRSGQAEHWTPRPPVQKEELREAVVKPVRKRATRFQEGK